MCEKIQWDSLSVIRIQQARYRNRSQTIIKVLCKRFESRRQFYVTRAIWRKSRKEGGHNDERHKSIVVSFRANYRLKEHIIGRHKTQGDSVALETKQNITNQTLTEREFVQMNKQINKSDFRSYKHQNSFLWKEIKRQVLCRLQPMNIETWIVNHAEKNTLLNEQANAQTSRKLTRKYFLGMTNSNARLYSANSRKAKKNTVICTPQQSKEEEQAFSSNLNQNNNFWLKNNKTIFQWHFQKQLLSNFQPK